MTAPKVVLELTPEQALVLFEWLARTEGARDATFEDQAEQRVLWDLEAMLESTLVEPLRPDYAHLLAKARAALRDG